MRQIIVGVDGSAASRAALAWAVDEAQDIDAEIRVVHVWDRPYVGGDAFARMLADADDIEVQARRELDDVIDSVDTSRLARPVNPVLLAGHPAELLLSEAKGADLLVIGQRGLGGIQLGSVGHRITLHAPCPVVVVPAP
jgi:nucleotide-binding universal stress UspA family protein